MLTPEERKELEMMLATSVMRKAFAGVEEVIKEKSMALALTDLTSDEGRFKVIKGQGVITGMHLTLSLIVDLKDNSNE